MKVPQDIAEWSKHSQDGAFSLKLGGTDKSVEEHSGEAGMGYEAILKGALDVMLAGIVALNLMLLTGCGSTSNGPTGGGPTPLPGALASGGASKIYVIEGTASGTNETILEFSTSSTGQVAPATTLIPPADISVLSVATDSTGEIYVGGGTSLFSTEILVYAAGATGSATPLRTIEFTGTEFSFLVPNTMTVDASGTIYVAGEGGNVAVIPAGASGVTIPSRLLTSGQLTGPVGVAVDAAGEIFVANETLAGPYDDYIQGSILVFAAGANGADDPVRVITGPTPTGTSSNAYYGITVDANGDISTVFDAETFDASGNLTGSSATIEEFAAGATGTPTPTRMIAGGSTELTTGGGLRVDAVGNLYTVNEGGTESVPVFSVLGFGPNATGNVAPGLNFSSSSWMQGGSEIAIR
jgi:hypothetical protein